MSLRACPNSVKVIPLTEADPDALRDCWNRCYPSKFSITAEIVRLNILHHPLTISNLSFALIEEDNPVSVRAFVCFKRSAHNRLFAGDHPDQLHLSAMAFRHKADMDLLSGHVNRIETPPKSKLVFGQDHGHLLPGIPTDATNIREWLISYHWSVSDEKEFDLERDLAGFKASTSAHESIANSNAQVRRATPADDRAIEDFFSETFPGRWQYDTLHLKCRSQQEWSDVFLLLMGERVHGFAYTQTFHSTKEPVAGCVWHTSLGENWGGLGPIGISKDVRGMGLGGALLEVALAELAQAGVRNCIIDWTTLADFYGKYGFRVTRTYEKAVY